MQLQSQNSAPPVWLLASGQGHFVHDGSGASQQPDMPRIDTGSRLTD
jgi:hypothetical protein